MFLDLRMPVKDGYEVIEETRRDKRFKDLPIIIVSAEGREWEIKRAMDLGANGHIMKPFKLKKLFAIAKKNG
jgi:CheY-like chemotaxis protein